MRGSRALAGALAVAATACGEGGATDAGPCWPLPGTPGGSVELGTGEIAFEPMPDVLPIIRNASQSDPFLQIYARIRGIPPGNPEDFFDPTNAKTKVAAVVDEIGLSLGVPCPASMGYVPAPEPGAYDLLRSLRVGFGTYPLADVDGKTVRVTVDVVGSNGLAASAEKLVVLEAPPPPVDAAPAGDAGVVDAAAADAP